jgi:hypothetical protein
MNMGGMVSLHEHRYKNKRFQVLTAARKKIGVLWDVASCSLGVD